jgi:hypothetical protein
VRPAAQGAPDDALTEVRAGGGAGAGAGLVLLVLMMLAAMQLRCLQEALGLRLLQESLAWRCSPGCTARPALQQAQLAAPPRQARRRRHRALLPALPPQVVVVYLASAADLLPSPEEWPQVWAEQEAWKKAREAFDRVRSAASPH